jgi:hypothetical protein
VDADKNTITLSEKSKGDKTYTVARDAVVVFDGEKQVKKLADIPTGASVRLKLLADQKTVTDIQVFGPTVQGTVKGNAAKDSVTIENKTGEQTFTVTGKTPILIEGERTGKLTDLIDGTVAQLRLSVDKERVLEIHASGPSFRGLVKGVDVAQNAITLTIGGKGGVGGEDKDFKTTKDTVVVTEIYSTPLKLADLKAEKHVVLRLTIDQKAAGKITILGE